MAVTKEDLIARLDDLEGHVARLERAAAKPAKAAKAPAGKKADKGKTDTNGAE